VKAEVLSTVIEGNCAEAVEHGSGGSRGISLRGDRLVVWVERGGRREVLLDVILDRGGAERLEKALIGTPFDLLFNVVTNAEMCFGADGRAHFCDEEFDYVTA
jgi:hypothetical protein